MDIILKNKKENSAIQSATITFDDNKNQTILFYQDSKNNEGEKLDTADFLKKHDSLDFYHPLLKEKPLEIKNNKASIIYQTMDEFFQVPSRLLANFIYFAPKLKSIEVSPSSSFEKVAKRDTIHYAANLKSKDYQALKVSQFEKLVSDLSHKDIYFRFESNFLLEQTVSYKNFNDSLDADLLYTGEKDIFLDALNKEEPIGIRYISAGIGHGAFATRDIKAGEIIGMYTGELLLEPRESLYSMWASNPMLSLRIDSADAGNLTRFINHADVEDKVTADPFVSKEQDTNVLITNCAYKSHSLYGFNFITVEAKRDIACGEQLLVFYGKEYWKNKTKFYLTPNYQVLTENGDRAVYMQRASAKDYQIMAENGVKGMERQLLARPMFALCTLVFIAYLINHFT